MEEFKSFVEKANRSFKTADHLTYITFNFVKDVKLTITIMENLYFALLNCVDAVLYYDRLFKRISSIPGSINSKIQIFKTKCSKRYDLEKYVKLIEEVRDIIERHKQSPIEFSRENKFVIYSENKIQVINIEKVKKYVNEAKPFIEKINKIFEENERRFGE